MRNPDFIAEHRGGTLTKERHFELILQACKCVEDVFHLVNNDLKVRLISLLKTGKDWTKGNASVGDCRNASLEAIALARISDNKVEEAIIRATGHAVATAHMADHSLRARTYILKAVKLSGNSVKTRKNDREVR